MRTLLVALVAMAPVYAQEAQKAILPPRLSIAGGMRIAPQTFTDLEKRFDDRLSKAGYPDPIYLLGSTRGLYLEGYGAVFTTEVDLIQSPRPNPFRPVIEPPEVASIHQRKLDHVPLLRTMMTSLMHDAGMTLLQIPLEQKIVVVVRILYMPWENTAGLPAQIVMSADRKSAIEGKIKVEEQ